ncbi:hypothetical protein JWG39_14925 [Desulforhopalus vacuolatus]|uniref:hypothetical protein n=1 Tax=Desulforhopalus vacuolatus TaxID=40414 RepID=UPI00196274DE|nr:hypothetical protein [Desulforhopalus vacuolatus]MBM9521113.1 hypothetical protein [Desulforhopalus vacuolatus]
MKDLITKSASNMLKASKLVVTVVSNPKLLEIPCSNVEQMKLINAFCWLDEYANKNKEVC